MATAPKPRPTASRALARQRDPNVARQAAAEAGFRAVQAGENVLRVLVFVRCSTRSCGTLLGVVVDTDQGPAFWSWITWMTRERYDAETAVLRRRARGSYPGEAEIVRRNRELLKSRGVDPGPQRLASARRVPHRRDVFDLLNADGVHPDLATRCRRHGFAMADRAALMEKVREAQLLQQPVNLGIHHPPR